MYCLSYYLIVFFNIVKEIVEKWFNLILLNVLSVKNFFIRKNKKCKKKLEFSIIERNKIV